MLIEEMQTFNEFEESDEAIERKNHLTNEKTKLYHLTARGLSLTPVIVELALWSDNNLREFNPIIRQSEALESMNKNKELFINKLKSNYIEKVTTTMLLNTQ